MAEPTTIARIAVAVAQKAKEVASSIWEGGEDGDHKSVVKPVFIALLAFLVLFSYIFSAAPLALWSLAMDAETGKLGAPRSDGKYVLPEIDKDGNVLVSTDLSISSAVIKHYKEEEKRLERFAKNKWNSGNGDVYTTPDWRWLEALDCVLSGNDFRKVDGDKGYYRGFHESILKATYTTRTVTVQTYAELDPSLTQSEIQNLVDSGQAFFSPVDNKYYQVVYETREVSYWKVGFANFKTIFKTGTSTLSDELVYYMGFESADYGGGWGNQGNAIGAYQFDRRYALKGFVNFCYLANPRHYADFAPYLGITIAQGDKNFEAAWQKAFADHTEEFCRLQDTYEYDNYIAPAQTILFDLGIDTSTRRDCIKGLFAGMANLFGQAGMRTILSQAGLTDSMSDLELARKTCSFIQSYAPGRYTYGDAYATRYKNELVMIEEFLSHQPETPKGTGLAPDRGDLNKMLADNYYAALRYINNEGSRVVFDKPALVDHLLNGKSRRSSDIVQVALEQVGNIGGDPYWGWYTGSKDAWCAMFVSWCGRGKLFLP
jgi:hypothetical protein